MNLSSLSNTLESAETGSRELDVDLALAVKWDIKGGGIKPFWKLVEDFGRDWAIGTASDHMSVYRALPNFTTSIDAALTLLPEGWEWGFSTDDSAHVYKRNKNNGFDPLYDSDARNRPPALALSAAICRALAGEAT